MPVYSQGDGRDTEDRGAGKPKDVGKQIEKGLADAGKAMGKFFGGFAGSEKKWQSKGEGHRLGADDAQQTPRPPAQQPRATATSGGPAPARAPHAPNAGGRGGGGSGPPVQSADKAAMAAAAEARLAKLNQPRSSTAKAQQATRYRSFAPAEPSSLGAGSDPIRAQFTSLNSGRSAADVDDALAAEKKAGGEAEGRWREAGHTGPAAAAAVVEADDALVVQLFEMGFDRDDAVQALCAAANDLEVAIAILSDGQGAAEEGRQAAPPSPVAAAAAVSQSTVTPLPPPTPLSEGEDGLSLVSSLMSSKVERARAQSIAAALGVVHKLLGNLAEKPGEAKFRRIRRTNPKIRAVLDAAPGSERLLLAAGFECDATGEFLDFAAEAGESKLAEALGAVSAGLAQLADGSIPLVAPEVRNTLVFRLAEGVSASSFDVPDDFYEIGPAEAKALLASTAAKQKDELTFRTRAQREADTASRQRTYVRALLRIRLPDGILLQGTFGAREPVSAVYDFVAGSLREQGLEFHLTRPTGTAEKGRSLRLESFTETISAAGLAPASVLNFNLAEGGGGGGAPFLEPELMDAALQLE